MSIKYNKRPSNGPSVHKIYQHLPLQDPPKFTQIWIFGLKTNHLATLVGGVVFRVRTFDCLFVRLMVLNMYILMCYALLLY
jgi:hypothetical protein